MSDFSFNPRIFAYLLLIIFIICLMAPNFVFGVIMYPFKDAIRNNENTSYVNNIVESNPEIIDGMKAHPEVVRALIENNTENLVEKVPITILVTPTPDGIKYFSGEYQNGTRLLGRPFSFFRYNVSGFKDMKITSRVYDYKIFDYLHWFNPSDYKYYLEWPSNKNSKFLFVFFNIYMDDTIGDDTRLWLITRDMFRVQIGSKLYAPSEYPLQLRIAELEEHVNYEDSLKSQAYSQTRVYLKNGVYRDTAGEISVNNTWLRAGKSNAEDGYLLFEIPKDTKESDILVLVSFYGFGNANWRLVNSVENYPYAD